MRAYKGFKSDLTCTYGRGVYQYEIGVPVREDSSKCQSRGTHCAENPLECLRWYPLGKGNRYFIVEAEGSIDELGGTDTQLACTEITLVKELSIKELAGHAMMYMVQHPLREWEWRGWFLQVSRDRAVGNEEGSIAIARGEHPKVRGVSGAVLGLIKESEGLIEDAKLFEVSGDIKPDTWYTLENRQPREVRGEA